jgi:hypothetical protein
MICIAIDDYDQLRDALTYSYNQLTELGRIVRADTRLGVHIVVAGETNGLSSGSDRLIKQIKLMRAGFCLVSAESVEFMGGRVTRAMRNAQLPNGRGFQVSRNSSDLAQFAHQQDPADLIRRIVTQWGGYSRVAWAHPATDDGQPAAAAPTTAVLTPTTNGFSLDFDFDLSGALSDYKKQQSEEKSKQRKGQST